MARIVAQLGIEKLCDIQLDYAYGHDLGRASCGASPAMRRTWIWSSSFGRSSGRPYYNAFISQILGAGCDGITSGLWGSHFVNFAQQAKPFGLFEQAKYISGGEIASHEIAGKMAEDYPDNVWSNNLRAVVRPLRPVARRVPEGGGREGRHRRDRDVAVLAYIGVKFYAAAATKAGSIESDAVAEALKGPQHRYPGRAAHHQPRGSPGRHRAVLGADGEEGGGPLPDDGPHHLHPGQDRRIATM